MKNDFIILVTEYAVIGSGYTSIAKMLIGVLNKLYPEVDIVVIGLSYKNEEHNENARIVAARAFSDVPTMLHNIFLSGASIRAVIVALDVPLQAKLLSWIRGNTRVPINETPYIGIFPIESPPVSLSFADALQDMDSVFTMTKFAVREIQKHGIVAKLLPQAIKLDFWRQPSPAEREAARRKYFINEEDFVVLVVGDNQERKNLSAAIAGFSDFILDKNTIVRDERGFVSAADKKVDGAMMHIVTRINSPYGWDLTDLLFRYGVISDVELHDRGMPDEDLRDLFFAADVLLSTSKAEGLGLPILEALACGLNVIGVDGAASKEHLKAAGGILMKPDYTLIDPFGNGERYLVSPETVANALKIAYNKEAVSSGREYVASRTNTQEFEEALRVAINGKA